MKKAKDKLKDIQSTKAEDVESNVQESKGETEELLKQGEVQEAIREQNRQNAASIMGNYEGLHGKESVEQASLYNIIGYMFDQNAAIADQISQTNFILQEMLKLMAAKQKKED